MDSNFLSMSRIAIYNDQVSIVVTDQDDKSKLSERVLKKFHRDGPPKAKRFSCSECYKDNLSQQGIKDHIKQDHSIGHFPCKIPNCFEIFQENHHLKQHLEMTHIEEGKWKCHILECGKRAKTKRYILEHIRACHNNEMFTCDMAGCNYESITSSGVTLHKRQKHQSLSEEQIQERRAQAAERQRQSRAKRTAEKRQQEK